VPDARSGQPLLDCRHMARACDHAIRHIHGLRRGRKIPFPQYSPLTSRRRAGPEALHVWCGKSRVGEPCLFPRLRRAEIGIHHPPPRCWRQRASGQTHAHGEARRQGVGDLRSGGGPPIPHAPPPDSSNDGRRRRTVRRWAFFPPWRRQSCGSCRRSRFGAVSLDPGAPGSGGPGVPGNCTFRCAGTPHQEHCVFPLPFRLASDGLTRADPGCRVIWGGPERVNPTSPGSTK